MKPALSIMMQAVPTSISDSRKLLKQQAGFLASMVPRRIYMRSMHIIQHV